MGTSSLATTGHNRTNDDLSRNITSLLENLLKDYDSNHHPGYESGSLLLSKGYDKTVTSIWPSAQSRPWIFFYFFLNWNNNSVFFWKIWCRFANGGQEQHSSTLYGSFLGTSNGNSLCAYACRCLLDIDSLMKCDSLVTGLFYGLLFSTGNSIYNIIPPILEDCHSNDITISPVTQKVVARQPLSLQRPNWNAKFEYQNARRYLEAGHVHL